MKWRIIREYTKNKKSENRCFAGKWQNPPTGFEPLWVDGMYTFFLVLVETKDFASKSNYFSNNCC